MSSSKEERMSFNIPAMIHVKVRLLQQNKTTKHNKKKTKKGEEPDEIKIAMKNFRLKKKTDR